MAEEKIEKGAISEEALEEIAGGLNISKDTLKKVAIGAGVTVIGLAGIGYGGKKLYDHYKGEKNSMGTEDNSVFFEHEKYKVGDQAFGGTVEEVAPHDDD